MVVLYPIPDPEEHLERVARHDEKQYVLLHNRLVRACLSATSRSFAFEVENEEAHLVARLQRSWKDSGWDLHLHTYDTGQTLYVTAKRRD